MKKIASALSVVLSLLAFAYAADTPTPTPDQAPYLRRYDAARVVFDEPHRVTLPGGQTINYYHAYLVRLFGVFPKQNGVALRLHIGERQIDGVSEFWGGLYFLIYEKKKLNELAGGDIRYSYPGETTPRLLATHFQPRLFGLTHPLPLDRALARPER